MKISIKPDNLFYLKQINIERYRWLGSYQFHFGSPRSEKFRIKKENLKKCILRHLLYEFRHCKFEIVKWWEKSGTSHRLIKAAMIFKLLSLDYQNDKAI